MYPQQKDTKYPIKGKLNRYGYAGVKRSYVYIPRIGRRRKCVDEAGNIYLMALGIWWKFPQEVEF